MFFVQSIEYMNTSIQNNLFTVSIPQKNKLFIFANKFNENYGNPLKTQNDNVLSNSFFSIMRVCKNDNIVFNLLIHVKILKYNSI